MAINETVRVVKNKYGLWELHYKNPDGLRRRPSVKTRNKTTAQRFAVKFMDWLLEGKDPEQELAMYRQQLITQRITLRELYSKFMQQFGHYQSSNMQSSYHYMFKNLCNFSLLVDIPIGSVQKSLVMDYIQRRIKIDKVGPATVNKEISFTKRMISNRRAH